MEQLSAYPDKYCEKCHGLISGNPSGIVALCTCGNSELTPDLKMKFRTQEQHSGAESLIIIKEARIDVMAFVLAVLNEFFQEDGKKVVIRNGNGGYELLLIDEQKEATDEKTD